MLTIIRNVLGFLRFVFRRWSEDRCPQIAASLTYTTLLALVPVFAIGVAMLSSMPFFEAMMVRLKILLLLNLVPEIAGKIITEYMEPISRNAARVTGISFGILFVTGIAVMFTVDRSLNAIWRVRRGRPLWVSIVAYVVLLTVGPILVGISVTVTTYLMALSSGVDALPREAKPYLLKAVPVAVSSVAFMLLYRIVPHRLVPWSHAIAGGVLAGVLFELMKETFAHYVAKMPMYNVVYGAFAMVPLFLIWVYLSWLVILFGAEVTSTAGYWRNQLWRRVATPGARFRDAVTLAKLLVASAGTAIPLETLCNRANLPADQLEDAIGHLVDAGLVRNTGKAGFVLARPPEEVTLGDVYRAAVEANSRMEPEDWTGHSEDIVHVIDQFQGLLNKPLTALLK